MTTPEILHILTTEVEADVVAVERLLKELSETRRRLPQEPSPEQLSHVGYLLHSIYTAWESAFHRIATAFENSLDPARWHEHLLRRMTLEIPGIRPAAVPSEMLEPLAALRAFRHFYRYSYAVPLRWRKMQMPLESVDEAALTVNESLRRFLGQIEKIAHQAEEDPS